MQVPATVSVARGVNARLLQRTIELHMASCRLAVPVDAATACDRRCTSLCALQDPSAASHRRTQKGYSMNHKARMLWLISGLAIAGAASVAQAAKPSTTAQQRKATVETIKKNHKGFAATQPRTMAQANATMARLPNGAGAMRAPTELWNNLAVQRDAQGSLHQVETSNGAQAPAIQEAQTK
jgi:hypothetical protein